MKKLYYSGSNMNTFAIQTTHGIKVKLTGRRHGIYVICVRCGTRYVISPSCLNNLAKFIAYKTVSYLWFMHMLDKTMPCCDYRIIRIVMSKYGDSCSKTVPLPEDHFENALISMSLEGKI